MVDVTFQQFLVEQRKTNQLLEKQIIDDQQGDNLVASAKNAAAEIGNTIIQERKNRKEHDETQEAVRTSVKDVERAIVDQGAIASKQNQQGQQQIKQFIGPLTAQQAAQQTQTKTFIQQQQKFIGPLTARQQMQNLGPRLSPQQKLQQDREKAILKLNDEQYAEVLQSRYGIERLEEDIEEMKKALSAGTEGSLEFYAKTLRLEDEKKRLRAKEQRRGLIGRFGADLSANPLVRGLKVATKGVTNFFSKFKALTTTALLGLLAIFVNSEFFETVKQFVKNVLDGDILSITGLIMGVVGGLLLLGGPLRILLRILSAFGLVPGAGAGAGKQGKQKKGGVGRKGFFGRALTTVGALFGVGATAAGVGATPTASTTPTSSSKPNLTSSLMNTQTNQQQRFKHNTTGRFAKFAKFAKLPGMTTLLGGVLLFNLLTSGASNKEIIKGAGPILGGVLGAVGGAKIGALLGLSGGPLALLTGLGGSILGALLGEKLGEYMMGFVLGEDVGKMVTSDLGGARDSIVKAFTGPETVEEHEGRIAQSMAQLKKAEQDKSKFGFSSITPGKKAQLESNIAESRAAIQKMKPQEPSMEASADQTQMRADQISQTSSDIASKASVNIINAPNINENPTDNIVSMNQSLRNPGSTGLVSHQGSLVSGFA